jgi:hypothetical protein
MGQGGLRTDQLLDAVANCHDQSPPTQRKKGEFNPDTFGQMESGFGHDGLRRVRELPGLIRLIC